jgi:UDP-GlcNAc:undecaprenyl-phosphate GlcNAc-1-phosphate transferase
LSDDLSAWLAFVVAFAAAAGLVPVAVRVAWRVGFLDTPMAHKSHGWPTPYLGGVAVVGATLLGGITLGGYNSTIAWITGGAIVMCVVGTMDDKWMLGPVVRLAVEVGLGAALWTQGLGWSAFNSDILSLALTMVWIVGIVNAFNLMDNLDGAAGSVGTICAAGGGGIALLYSGGDLAALAFALSGACAGFLLYNLRRPSRIFLGDGGSMPIGFLLAAMLMVLTHHLDGLGAAAVVAAAPVVGLPVLDTTMVMVSRARRGIPLFSGGRDHLTHRLLGSLGTPGTVAAALAIGQAVLCALGIALFDASETVVIATGIAYVLLGSLVILVLDLNPLFRPDPRPPDQLRPSPTLGEPARQESAGSS